jgi:hypothetical protein
MKETIVQGKMAEQIREKIGIDLLKEDDIGVAKLNIVDQDTVSRERLFNVLRLVVSQKRMMLVVGMRKRKMVVGLHMVGGLSGQDIVGENGIRILVFPSHLVCSHLVCSHLFCS